MASVTCDHLPDICPARASAAVASHTKRPYEDAVTAVDLTAAACCTAESTTTTSTESLHKRQVPSMKRVDPPTNTPRASEPVPNANHHAATSRPTSAATPGVHSRSASRSASRPPSSRRSSLHSSRRAVPNAAIVPVQSARSTAQERRESLLALHRESVRLFTDKDASRWSSDDARLASGLERAHSTTYRARHDARASWEAGGSAPPSPIGSAFSSRGVEHSSRPQSSVAIATVAPRPVLHERSHTLPDKPPVSRSHLHSPSSSSAHGPATVSMEWTSPSTRRREYEKIDRASRGVRGLWRRVAPRWCRARDARTPFFEEGRLRQNREGSVRRFRMDLPDDEGGRNKKPKVQVLDCVPKGESRAKLKGRWPYMRSKTS